MQILKYLATSLYNFAVPVEEQVSSALEKLTPEQNRAQSVSYLRRTAPQLTAGTREYNQVHQAAEDFVLLHHKATSFNQMCRSQVRRTANDAYYLHLVIGKILQTQVDADATKGGEAAKLVDALVANEVLMQAASERNPIKRRAILRNGVKAHYPDLTADQLNFVAEALITYGDIFKG